VPPPSGLSDTRSAGDLRRGGAGGASEEASPWELELAAASEDELGRRFEDEAERDEEDRLGGADEEERDDELRRSEPARSELGRSLEPELELDRFGFEELDRSEEGRLEPELLERRRPPSREDDEEEEEEERRRATGVSQYGQRAQRGSTGLLQARHGSLSRCWHSGQRSQSSSIGWSQC